MVTHLEPDARRRLRRLALAALISNVAIFLTGGIVRVSGSGLGCPDWPTCEGGRIAPSVGEHPGWEPYLEFGNRLLTFVLVAIAVALVVQVRRTRPHTRTVMLATWAIPAGIVANAVLGGITVWTGLSPYTVAGHFLLSIGIVAAAVILHERLRDPDDGPPASRSLQHATSVLLAVALTVIVVGTVVTGSGPHGGDPSAPRFDLDIRFVALLHADLVWLLLGLTTALVVLTWRSGPPRLRTALRALLALELAQGTLGYTQYALGIPATLVALHILGAALVWTAAVSVWIRARPPVPAGSSRIDLDDPEVDRVGAR